MIRPSIRSLTRPSPPPRPLALRAAALLALAGTAIPGAVAAQEPAFPELSGRVVDTAGILSAAERAALEETLARLEAETTVQVVVAAVPRLPEEFAGAIEDYSLRLAEHWGIGQAETDNGALVVVSVEDRRARIEVGYGLEGAIPDGLAGRIIRDRLAPRFAAGEYAAGLGATAEALGQAARGEYREQAAPTGRRGREDRSRGSGLWILGAFVLLQLLGWIGNAFHPAGAAVLGGGLAALVGFLFLGGMAMLWLAPMGLLAGLGATAFTRAAAGRGGRGWGYAGIPGGGGAAFHGSGMGGGFSGFVGGGGGFGGGGASGSW